MGAYSQTGWHSGQYSHVWMTGGSSLCHYPIYHALGDLVYISQIMSTPIMGFFLRIHQVLWCVYEGSCALYVVNGGTVTTLTRL